MEKTRVLFISQEIIPYTTENEIAKISRQLPQGIQDKGKEVRIFMPRYGKINERRHQLHEVIRLSGMNLIIDDTDHPLIIKVGSIPQARMQVYFIDNEEYFQRKAVLRDANDNMFEDNDERSIFFGRGVLETVKKLGWSPDIIHCHGWMTALIPTFVKKLYSEDPIFKNSKIVFSAYDNGFEGALDQRMIEKAQIKNITAEDLSSIKVPSYINLNKLGIQTSDAAIWGSSNLHEELEKELNASSKPVLTYKEEESYVDAYDEFYEEVLAEDSVLM